MNSSCHNVSLLNETSVYSQPLFQCRVRQSKSTVIYALSMWFSSLIHQYLPSQACQAGIFKRIKRTSPLGLLLWKYWVLTEVNQLLIFWCNWEMPMGIMLGLEVILFLISWGVAVVPGIVVYCWCLLVLGVTVSLPQHRTAGPCPFDFLLFHEGTARARCGA